MTCGCARMRVDARVRTGAAMVAIRRGFPADSVAWSEVLAAADHRGIVRWWGIEWYGVPAPLRWRYGRRLVEYAGTEVRDLPGCGCVRALKIRVRWIRSRVRASLVPLRPA